ncbi:MAG: metallophosphoesterase family protein [Candidatus Deferrimicrobiaceae bacterium]
MDTNARQHRDRSISGEREVSGRVALFGGIYNNHLALATLLDDASSRASEIFCLGDVGAFGPYPDRSVEILRDAGVPIVQGTYDRSIGLRRGDCACGYTDPRDNHFAALSYAYTFRNTSERNKDYLATLPDEIRLRGPKGERILLCHGSPRRQNEFLWESLSPDPFLTRLLDDAHCDVLAVTHTGIPWKRFLPGRRFVLNVGAIGRPANDGQTHVSYAVLDLSGEEPDATFVPLRYDHERLAAEMRAERIVDQFVETVETGWWTTCLEILPARERARGMY